MSAALTQEDTRRLEKTTSIRERMIDLIQPEEIIKDPKSMFAFVALMDSMDKGILGRAKVKLEEESNKNMSNVQDTMAAMLLGIHSGINKKARNNDNLTLPANIDSEAVEGQKFVGLDERTFEEFNASR